LQLNVLSEDLIVSLNLYSMLSDMPVAVTGH